MTETTYRFAPHPGGGVLLGLRLPQLCGLALAAFGALGALRVGGAGGLAARGGDRRRGRERRARPAAGADARAVGAPRPRGSCSAASPAPRGSARSARSSGTSCASRTARWTRSPPGRPRAGPAELAELELLEVTLSRYEHARLGVVKDRRAHTYTATVRVSGRAFALLAPEDREARLEEYGAVLAALARDDSPVRRVAWIERTLPADADALGGYLLDAKRPDATFEDPPDELVSYLQLIGRAGDVAEEHELLFTHPDRRAAPRRAARDHAHGRRRPRRARRPRRRGRAADRAARPGRDHRHRPPDPRRVWRPRSARAMTRGGTASASANSTTRRRSSRGSSRTPPRRPRAMTTGGASRSTGRCTARSGSPNGRGSTCAPCSSSRC